MNELTSCNYQRLFTRFHQVGKSFIRLKRVKNLKHAICTVTIKSPGKFGCLLGVPRLVSCLGDEFLTENSVERRMSPSDIDVMNQQYQTKIMKN